MISDNHSIFVQDHWTINNRLSADLGARFEQVMTESGEIRAWTPGGSTRLAVAYDLKGGNNQTPCHHGQCAGRYNGADWRQQPGRQPGRVDIISWNARPGL